MKGPLKLSLVVRVNRFGRRLSDAMPAPLAAPETTRLHRLRVSVLLLLAAIAALTAIFPWLHGAGRATTIVAVLAWQSCALAAIFVGVIWVRDKNRADDAWLMREEEDRP